MTDHRTAAVAGTGPAPGAGLEPDAIGVTQDTIIGIASSAPAATVGLSLAALVVATAYGSGPILILTAIPMLIIANAYRWLNLWKANTGASFEWVGRAIDPYLGVLTGWLMIAAYVEPVLVAHRHRHRRAGRGIFRAVHPALLVLPDPPGE